MKETQRVIKFRAWDGHKMITPSVIGKHGEWYATGIDFEDRRSDKEGLMQFTGLQDSNGVDIYEGDLWQRDGFIGKVVFEFSGWAIRHVPGSDNIQYPSFYSNAATGEVIGHIYDPKFSNLL